MLIGDGRSQHSPACCGNSGSPPHSTGALRSSGPARWLLDCWPGYIPRPRRASTAVGRRCAARDVLK